MKKLQQYDINCYVRTALTILLGMAMVASVSRPATAKGEDATELLTKAATTMAGVKSFHFELSTVHGKSTILRNLELAGVEGDVQRPDSFQATITAKIAIIEVEVDVVGIGAQLWVTDPTSKDKKYIQVSTGDEGVDSETAILSSLINPDKLLLSAVGLVQNPVVDGTESVDGERTTRIVGTVDLSRLKEIGFATPEAAGDLLILGEMPVTIWIDADGYVRSMEIEGPLTTDESPDVVRRLDVTNIDEPVEITAPEATS